MQYYISLHSTFRRPKLQEHYEIQNQSKFVMVQLQLEEVIVVMDQGLYAELHRLHGSTHTANVMGTFHITSNGKRFQDADMHDICIAPGIIAEGTISGVS